MKKLLSLFFIGLSFTAIYGADEAADDWQEINYKDLLPESNSFSDQQNLTVAMEQYDKYNPNQNPLFMAASAKLINTNPVGLASISHIYQDANTFDDLDNIQALLTESLKHVPRKSKAATSSISNTEDDTLAFRREPADNNTIDAIFKKLRSQELHIPAQYHDMSIDDLINRAKKINEDFLRNPQENAELQSLVEILKTNKEYYPQEFKDLEDTIGNQSFLLLELPKPTPNKPTTHTIVQNYLELPGMSEQLKVELASPAGNKFSTKYPKLTLAIKNALAKKQ